MMKLHPRATCIAKGKVVLKRKSMMTKRSVVLAACLSFCVLLLSSFVIAKTTFAQATTTRGARGSEAQCSNSTLNGRYVFTVAGFQITKRDQVPFAVAGTEVFDGHGNLRGVISQSMNGTITRHVSITGTYTVNHDCTITETVTVPGAVLHFDQFTTNDGSVFTFIETDPGIVASGFETRGTGQRVGN